MSTVVDSISLQAAIDCRRDVLRDLYQQALWKKTDRVFAALLAIEWLAAIALALWIAPYSWEGLERRIHPHVWAAVGLGGLISALPILLALTRPGETSTRMVISVAQMLYSGLLIHLSGGRIETHFHIFGSLAFLSFYRDWRVLIPATLTVAADHALRGMFWPESVFGVLSASQLRWMEHAGWVAFEDVFLLWACVRGANEVTILASRQAELESSNQRVEAEVTRKTAQLESVSQELMNTARRAGMAEIATGVLHNVGNVLNSVNVAASVVHKTMRESEISSLVLAGKLLQENQDNLPAFFTSDARGQMLPGFLIELSDHLAKEQAEVLSEMQRLEKGLEHVKQIVGAQQQHAKDGTLRERVVPAELFEQAITMGLGAADTHEIDIVREFEPMGAMALDKHKILQILVNLLANAKKATQGAAQPRLTVRIRAPFAGDAQRLEMEVADNGEGIDEQNLPKVFAHGFTTRSDGHGFGLHSAANAAAEMGGKLSVHSDGRGRGASFTLNLLLTHLTAAEELLARKKVA